VIEFGLYLMVRQLERDLETAHKLQQQGDRLAWLRKDKRRIRCLSGDGK